MSDLIAVAYDGRAMAERVRDELAQMTREHVIEIEGAVVVTRERGGKVKLHQTLNPAGAPRWVAPPARQPISASTTGS